MQHALNTLSNLGRPFVIIVEGNIASGKTTFLNHFKKKYDNICVLAEPVDAWRNCGGFNLLKDFYEDSKKWSFTFQSYVQLTLLQNHTLHTNHSIKFMERSLYSSLYCFTHKMKEDGLLPVPSASVVEEWFKWTTKQPNVNVDLIVYLRTTPEVAFDRLKKRNRIEEKSVPLEYLQDLHVRHENWLNHKVAGVCPAPVFILNGNLDNKIIVEEYDRFEDLLFSKFRHDMKQ